MGLSSRETEDFKNMAVLLFLWVLLRKKNLLILFEVDVIYSRQYLWFPLDFRRKALSAGRNLNCKIGWNEKNFCVM